MRYVSNWFATISSTFIYILLKRMGYKKGGEGRHGANNIRSKLRMWSLMIREISIVIWFLKTTMDGWTG